MIISVGYHKNLASWFSTKQFSALDNGRKWAQREWAKVCNITWTAAKYPRVTIKPVYDKTADLVSKWGELAMGNSGYSKIGAVVGATYKEQGIELRKRMPHTFFLVPGYGAQGLSLIHI